MNDTRYLYEVRPVRPIIISGKSIRIPCSIQLTKAEVIEYMKSAAIYRRFSNSEPVRVTGENLDALHQQTYNPNFKSVVSVPTISVPKIEITTPKITEDPVVAKPSVEETEEDNSGKKSKEEESSVISSETSEELEKSDLIEEEDKSNDEEPEAPVASAPTINVKGNGGNKNKNHYNNGNKNYKK